MCFVIILSDYFDFCCFTAMTLQLLLHLVVNHKCIFTINYTIAECCLQVGYPFEKV